METLRTPDDRFASLPEFPFAPHYADIADGEGGELRVHYIDEGEGPTLLFLHGSPTWSFLYRGVVVRMRRRFRRASRYSTRLACKPPEPGRWRRYHP